MRRSLTTLVIAASLALIPGLTRAQTLTVNPPITNGYSLVPFQPFIGQSFVALNSGLVDFTLYVGSQTQFDYQAGIGALSGGTFNTLFLSSVRAAAGHASYTYSPLLTSFDSPLALTPGQTYIAFLQYVSLVPSMGVAGGADVYADGQGYFAGSNTNGTVQPITGSDVLLTAHFTTLDSTTTPEPASITLLATGLVGLCGAARRRKAKHRA